MCVNFTRAYSVCFEFSTNDLCQNTHTTSWPNFELALNRWKIIGSCWSVVCQEVIMKLHSARIESALQIVFDPYRVCTDTHFHNFLIATIRSVTCGVHECIRNVRMNTHIRWGQSQGLRTTYARYTEPNNRSISGSTAASAAAAAIAAAADVVYGGWYFLVGAKPSLIVYIHAYICRWEIANMLIVHVCSKLCCVCSFFRSFVRQ